MPNKLFEYAFAGLPIIASNFPDLSYILEKYDLGFVCDADSKEDIKKMIENFEKMENVSKKDTTKLYDLTWQKQESNLVTLYQNLTEEQKN